MYVAANRPPLDSAVQWAQLRESTGCNVAGEIGLAAAGGAAGPGIGELNERSLHRALKERYAERGAVFEQPVEGFVADVMIGERIVEIHTGSFTGLRKKLTRLLPKHPVTLVYPIAQDRYIVKLPTTPDAAGSRRKSPKHDSLFFVFSALTSIPRLLQHPNLTLEVVMTIEEVVRVPGATRRRRNGWVSVDRRLLEVAETHRIEGMGDLFAHLDERLPPRFTTLHLAEAMRSSRRLGQQAAFCFREAGLVEVCAKAGNALVYRRCPA